MDSNEQFRAYMKAAAAGLEPSMSACPTADELIGYHRGELTAEARQPVESHLINCPACRERLRDVAEFFDAAREGEQTSPPADVQREWGAFRSRIDASPSAPAKKDTLPFRRSAPKWMLALAACLVLALAASTVWSLRRQHLLGQLEAENRRLQQQVEAGQQQLARVQAPRVNTSIYDVFSEQTVARSAAAERAVNRVTVSEGIPFTLLLNGEGVGDFRDYAVEILDHQGRSVWRAQGAKRAALGNFAITLNGSFLTPGEYRFRLSGRSDAGYEPITDYRIIVAKLP